MWCSLLLAEDWQAFVNSVSAYKTSVKVYFILFYFVHIKNEMHENTVELQRDSMPSSAICFGTITQMEAFMKRWWKKSALYAQSCTLLHFQLIRSAQLQKGERLPRQPPISPPPSPSVPLSRLLSAEVAWQREVQPLLYWNQCKNMHLHNKACMESWERWENAGCTLMCCCSVGSKTLK